MTTLKDIDFKHLWHPFTQAKVWFEEDPLIIERAEGMELIDTDGRRYLDGVSSLWCNVHGHNVPELVQALKDQADTLCHSTLLGISHRPALELAERLVEILPPGLSRIFYSDSGSAAVEAGLRMCLEWWQKQPAGAGRKKTKLLSLDTAYHGDTLGAVGVGYVKSFHRDLAANVIPALRVSPPHYYRFFEGVTEDEAETQSLSQLRRVLESSADSIGAMIIEPLVQGAAGIWVHSAKFLAAAADLCRRHDVLVIADEVATGFGKTGSMFAVSQANITPDVLIVAKGLSAGLLPISAVCATEEIFRGFIGEPAELKTFFYGQTYCGNPLAARVACANLDLFRSSHLLETLPRRIAQFDKLLTEIIAPLPHVDEVRRCGVMTGIELTAVPGKRQAYDVSELAGARVVREARKLGAVIRPLGNVIVLMPPLAMKAEQLSSLVEITAQSVRQALG